MGRDGKERQQEKNREEGMEREVDGGGQEGDGRGGE